MKGSSSISFMRTSISAFNRIDVLLHFKNKFEMLNSRKNGMMSIFHIIENEIVLEVIFRRSLNT